MKGSGEGTPISDPVLGTDSARASTEGIDFGAALDYTRHTGRPALRALAPRDRSTPAGC